MGQEQAAGAWGPVRRVFFDAGGVLIRLPRVRERVRAYARARGLDLSYAAVEQAVSEAIAADAALGPRDLIRSRTEEERRILDLFSGVAIRLGLGKDAAPDLRDVAYYACSGSLYEDVAPTLAALAARGIPAGLISNAPPSLLGSLVRLDLAGHLHPLVMSWEVGAVKPSPEIFRAALERAGARAEDCLFVDDLPENVAGARAMGLRAIQLRRSPQDPPAEGPFLNTLEAVVRWIDAPDGRPPEDLRAVEGLRLPVA